MKTQTSSKRPAVSFVVARPLKANSERANHWLARNEWWVGPLGIAVLIFAASLWALGYIPDLIGEWNTFTQYLRSFGK